MSSDSGDGAEAVLYVVLAGGIGVAVAQVIAYGARLNGRYDVSGHVAFWSTWVAGLGLLALGGLRRDDGLPVRAALAFFGIVTLLLVGGGPEALYELRFSPFG